MHRITRTNCCAIEYITSRNLLQLTACFSFHFVIFNLTIKHQSSAMEHGPALNVSLPVFQVIKNLSLRKLSLHEVTHYMATGSEYLSQDMI